VEFEGNEATSERGPKRRTTGLTQALQLLSEGQLPGAGESKEDGKRFWVPVSRA
jgi:hypothetical protein